MEESLIGELVWDICRNWNWRVVRAIYFVTFWGLGKERSNARYDSGGWFFVFVGFTIQDALV